MIRHTLLTSQVRFFDKDSIDPFEPYVAITTLTWETAEIVWLVGLHGRINKSMLRELLDLLHGMGTRKIRAYRAGTHGLPCSELIGENLYEVDIQTAIPLMAKK